MKDQFKKISLLSEVVLALFMALLVTPAFAVPTPSFRIAPIDSAPYGRTYAEWSAAWQQWALSIPAAAHPLFDTAPADTGQTGPVFFLGGKFCMNGATDCGTSNVVRHITVPAGKALYFPVVNSENSTVETGHGDINGTGNVKDINALRKSNQDAVDSATNNKLALEIDGQKVDLANQRVQSVVFGFCLPQGDVFTAIGEGIFSEGCYFPGVDEGYYIMLNPFPPGKEHKIHFHAAVPSMNWVMDIIYHVTWQK